jgi:hypothetical protein
MPITNLKDKARGLAGIHEMVRVFLCEEGDFTAPTFEWPKLSDISGTGDITTVIPLTSTTKPSFLMSPQTGEGEYKKNKGAGPGYETWSHGPLKGTLVGDTKEQHVIMNYCTNRPVVAIAEWENGDRQVFGTLRKPCQIEFATKKNKDGDTIEVTIDSPWTYNFAPPYITTLAVIVPA